MELTCQFIWLEHSLNLCIPFHLTQEKKGEKLRTFCLNTLNKKGALLKKTFPLILEFIVNQLYNDTLRKITHLSMALLSPSMIKLFMKHHSARHLHTCNLFHPYPIIFFGITLSACKVECARTPVLTFHHINFRLSPRLCPLTTTSHIRSHCSRNMEFLFHLYVRTPLARTS